MRRLAAILAAPALLLVVLAPAQAAVPTLTYSAHVSSLGWLPDVTSGNRSFADTFTVTR